MNEKELYFKGLSLFYEQRFFLAVVFVFSMCPLLKNFKHFCIFIKLDHLFARFTLLDVSFCSDHQNFSAID
jgi:hypothetical protein